MVKTAKAEMLGLMKKLGYFQKMERFRMWVFDLMREMWGETEKKKSVIIDLK